MLLVRRKSLKASLRTDALWTEVCRPNRPRDPPLYPVWWVPLQSGQGVNLTTRSQMVSTSRMSPIKLINSVLTCVIILLFYSLLF